ncbi:MAG: hypothetical protein M3167_13255, partial [Acidobacteriota bacterium]|nr:hypothetical protein [Acidobacteriota bacterium]
MTSRLILRSGLAAVGFAAGVLLATAQDAAYVDDQIREGRRAWDDKQYVEAADHFRLAGFAAVEAPVRLTEALARLALAQDAAGAHAAADATLARFLEVEQHSSRYGEAALELPLRGAFERLLRTRVPAERLAAVPTLASAARGDPPVEARVPPPAPSAGPDTRTAAPPAPTEPVASPPPAATPAPVTTVPRPTMTPPPPPPTRETPP